MSWAIGKILSQMNKNNKFKKMSYFICLQCLIRKSLVDVMAHTGDRGMWISLSSSPA